MQKMYVDAVNFCGEVVKAIESRRHALPVIMLLPVSDQFLLVAERKSLLPILNGFGIRITGSFQTPFDVF